MGDLRLVHDADLQVVLILVPLEEAVLHVLTLVAEDLVQADVFHRAEDVPLDVRIRFLQLLDQLLRLETLRAGLTVGMAGRAGLGEVAGALDEVQAVVVTPVLDFRLTDKVKRADQLHAREVRGVELRHHRLVLAGVEHAHEDGLDDVVEVVAERDLVAAEALGFLIEVAAAHAGADVARGLRDVVDGVEDICFEDRERDAKEIRVPFDNLTVCLVIARVHAQEHELERDLIVALQLLEELRHEHRILTAGDADRNAVTRLDELIIADGLHEHAEEVTLELLAEGLLDVVAALLGIHVLLDLAEHPLTVAAGEAVGLIALRAQVLGCRQGEVTVLTVQYDPLILRDAVVPLGDTVEIHPKRIRHLARLKILFTSHIDQVIALPWPLLELLRRHFLRCILHLFPLFNKISIHTCSAIIPICTEIESINHKKSATHPFEYVTDEKSSCLHHQNLMPLFFMISAKEEVAAPDSL